MSAPWTIRPATAEDLPAIWNIRFLNDIAGETDLPDMGDVPPYLAHVLTSGSLLVSEVAGEVAAYAGTVDRGGLTYLTDLFVHPEHQSLGLGRTLLDTCFHAVPQSHRGTLASVDPRAIALYTRFGMAPSWPNLLLEAPVERLHVEPSWSGDLLAMDAGDPSIVAADAGVSLRSRAADFQFWRDGEEGRAYWLTRGGNRTGYAVIRTGAGRLWHPEAVTVGPCGSATPTGAVETVLAAVAAAIELGSYIEIAVPGPHPALRPLLQAGFRIVYVETACLGERFQIDPARYIGSGGDLF